MRKYRKFAEGGTPALDELASGREKGSFDEDVYARAKRFLERGGKEEPVARPVPKAKPRPSAEPAAERPRSPSAPSASASSDIPGAGPYRAPASTGEMLGETERNVLNMLGAVSGLAGMAPAARAVRSAIKPRTELAIPETPVTFLGASGRRSMAAPEKLSGPRKALPGPKEKPSEGTKSLELSKESVNRAAAKRVMEAGPKKKPRIKDEEVTDLTIRDGGSSYARGGSVRGGGCERRGLRKCKVV